MSLAAWVADNKEVVAAAGAGAGALIASVVAGMRQSRKSDASPEEQAPYLPRQTAIRLNPEDRAVLTELRDGVCDLVRVVKRHGDQIEDHADALGRRARRAEPG